MFENVLFKTSTIDCGNMSFRFGEKNQVLENRRRFLEKIGGDYGETICMSCNHGEHILAINRENSTNYMGARSPEKMPEAEVLVTTTKGLALMVLTADCLPTLFHDPTNEVIALAHLNRKTIAHDLGQKTVRFMAEHFESQPEVIEVQIGPHIKKESYSFTLPLETPPPPQLASHMHEESGHVSLDLSAAEVAQLTAVGIKREHISVSAVDVGVDQNYFSHHRSKTKTDAKHPRGRMASVAILA